MEKFERTQYAVAVVGAGIIGLFTALHLARAGVRPILVVDRGYLSSGASGRNGGGVRQQWETRATVRLAQESVKAYRHFGREFGFNVWFRQGGYLFLAETASELDQLRRMEVAVRAEGLKVRILTPAQVADRVPEIVTEGLAGGSFLDSDGTLYPFPAVWGLYEAVRSLGVEVALGVEAAGVEQAEGTVRGLATNAGIVRADWVVNAAGGWSGEFTRRAGLGSVNVASRHEILATEPLKPFLDPMVVRPRDGLYFSQTMRGEVVGGLTLAHPKGTPQGMTSSTSFLRAMASALIGLMPRLGSLGVLRAWSGFYDDTPDGLPVLGEDTRLKHFVHANGFGGHGFMLAPSATLRVAQMILGAKTDLDPALFGPERFAHGPLSTPVERLQLG
ncbi:MAG: FAD-binding oxidoreductase [Thermoplasmata archaeon]